MLSRIAVSTAATTIELRSRPPKSDVAGSGVPWSRLSTPSSRRMHTVIARFVNEALITPKHRIPAM